MGRVRHSACKVNVDFAVSVLMIVCKIYTFDCKSSW